MKMISISGPAKFPRSANEGDEAIWRGALNHF